MTPTTPETWWTDLRWRIAVKCLRAAVRIAPDGDANKALCGYLNAWNSRILAAWELRRSANLLG